MHAGAWRQRSGMGPRVKPEDDGGWGDVSVTFSRRPILMHRPASPPPEISKSEQRRSMARRWFECRLQVHAPGWSPAPPS